MAKSNQPYKAFLEQGFRDYWAKKLNTGEFLADMLDPKHGLGRLPVFRAGIADQNVLLKPDAGDEEKKRLLSLIPAGKRHKWFRSMSSSQALALSVFGNLVVHGQLEWLRGLEDDDGNEAFGSADLSAYNFSVEHEIGMLNEPRPTSLDVLISGRYRVALECKLSKAEVGSCSRPRLKKDSIEFCDGSYSIQRSRKYRCSLTEIGVLGRQAGNESVHI